jgi:very-short-patch-repair endonuclease
MARDVAAVVGPAGWATTAELTTRVDRGTLRAWVATGRLVRLRAGVYATPAAAGRWHTRVAAALAGRSAVAGHSTALALWELIPPPPGPVHVCVEDRRSGRGSPGVVLHRSTDLDDVRRRVRGLPVTAVERAVVDTWGSLGGLTGPAVRAAAITAVRRRCCRPSDLAYELARRPRLRGRAELAQLVQLLEQGCQSELEIWGCRHVLVGPGMPRFSQQHPVTVAGRRFLLDAACEEVLLAVEMDGAAFHGSRDQRESDIQRDALLAAIGWQTLRFSHARMTGAPESCRGDVRRTYEARRRLFARQPPVAPRPPP